MLLAEQPRVVVIGGGLGGLPVANGLAAGGKCRVTLINTTNQHVYQPGFLYVPFGRIKPGALLRNLRQLLRREVEMTPVPARQVDTASKTVLLEDGRRVGYEWLVLAPGTEYDPARIPGFEEHAHHFYSLEAALTLMSALHQFPGGDIVVGVSSLPYKCPPGPLEFTLLLDDFLRRRGMAGKYSLTFFTPFSVLIGAKSVRDAYLPLFQRRGIRVVTGFTLQEVDGGRHCLVSQEGEECPYDLAIVVPPHRGTRLVRESGLGDRQGWIPTDRGTLRVVGQNHTYALGDAADLPLSRSGASAHFQADVVVRNVKAEIQGRPIRTEYTGRVLCLTETGGGMGMLVQYSYDLAPAPPPPTPFPHWGKAVFHSLYWRLVPPRRFPLHGMRRRMRRPRATA